MEHKPVERKSVQVKSCILVCYLASKFEAYTGFSELAETSSLYLSLESPREQLDDHAASSRCR